MPEQKLKPTNQTVADLVEALPDAGKREDTRVLVKLFKKLSGQEPVVWTYGLIGFGQVHYQYASGHKGYTVQIGFAPRKDKFTFYLCGHSFKDPLFEKLGKYKHGVGCLYVKKLADIDLQVLESIIAKGLKKKE